MARYNGMNIIIYFGNGFYVQKAYLFTNAAHKHLAAAYAFFALTYSTLVVVVVVVLHRTSQGAGGITGEN